jgi:antirestriction protein ArdC
VETDDDVAAPDRHRQLLQQLDEQTETLRTSEGWQRWLAFASSFTEYSLNNQLLILMQRPEATRVAGYRAWQALGRQVNKGERGIAILAPLTRKVEDDDGQCTRVLSGFRIVRVFDVAQTAGDTVVKLTLPDVTGSSQQVFDAMLAAAHAEALHVVQRREQGDVNGKRGWINHATRTITLIDYGQGVDNLTRTMLHELGHWCDPSAGHSESRNGDPVLELVAEGAAWIVGAGLLGLDMIEASSTYVASWLERIEILDADFVSQLASRTLHVARRLQSVVSPHLDGIEIRSGLWPSIAAE